MAFEAQQTPGVPRIPWAPGGYAVFLRRDTRRPTRREQGENKVKTRQHATNSTQLNGQTADCVWYPGGGSVKRPEVCVTDSSKIEILGMERVKTR